jgi:hypothetical protein
VFIKIAVIDNDFYKSSSSGKKMHLDTYAVFIRLVVFIKIAVIDNDFYKSSSSGKKMHLDTYAVFIRLVVFMTSR